MAAQFQFRFEPRPVLFLSAGEQRGLELGEPLLGTVDARSGFGARQAIIDNSRYPLAQPLALRFDQALRDLVEFGALGVVLFHGRLKGFAQFVFFFIDLRKVFAKTL